VGVYVAAFDLATSVGCADGSTDTSKPRLWTWALTDAGDGRARRLAFLRRFLDAYFAETKVDVVVYEKPLGIAIIAAMMAKGQYRTSEDVLSMLRGAIGVLEACAAYAGVPEIRSIDVKDARQHLVGQRTFRHDDAKAMTMRACQALGWEPANYDESDAAALWSLAVGQHNPRMAAATRAVHMAADADTFESPRSSRKRRPRNAGLFG
jgi:hypothetical protein